MIRLPLPGEHAQYGIVIASVWFNDSPEDGDMSATFMLLHGETPYYGIYEGVWRNDRWNYTLLEEHENINPATDAYANNGGDY